MRVRILSDLHLEHAPLDPDPTDADVVVLAGDTAPGTAGVEWARAQFPGVPVLYVAGNHEFYGQDFPGLIDRLRTAAFADADPHVHVLEQDSVTIGNVRFLGCSLWSDFDYAGADQREQSMRVCERIVNDFRRIRVSDEDRRLSPADTRAAHLRSRAWLQDRLAEPHAGPTVVITHHAPLVRRPLDSPLRAALAGAFASDLSALIDGATVDLWIFGHIHRTVDVVVNGSRLLSNQRGYPHEPVDGFDPRLTVEL